MKLWIIIGALAAIILITGTAYTGLVTKPVIERSELLLEDLQPCCTFTEKGEERTCAVMPGETCARCADYC